MTDKLSYRGFPLKSLPSIFTGHDSSEKRRTEVYWPQRIKDDPPAVGTLLFIIKDPENMTDVQQHLLAELCPYYAELREP